ncbi:MAG: DNA polymerase domain-containing protein [Promethearchaeota archaeon]
MKLINIHNVGRKIYIFSRDKSGLIWMEDDSFFPYYYEPDPEGKFISYDNKPLKRLFCSEPKQVAQMRSDESYEADIIFTRRYMIDKIDKLTRVDLKFAFVDIEVLAQEMPDVSTALNQISCISVYNSENKVVNTFYLGDYKTEEDLIKAYVNHMRQEKFDIWLSWNVKFDYNYLYNRYKRIFGHKADFARDISPIHRGRRPEFGQLMNKDDYRDCEQVWFPAGISIIDYMQWFKKYTLGKRKSYRLDYIAQYDLKEESWGKEEFGILSEEIKKKNINDIQRMVKLEKKFKLVSYFDETRRFAKVEWEDLYHNSRTLDMLCLQEAKKKGIILPNKPHGTEKEDFEGAFRDICERGAHFNIAKADLGSAYPQMIKDFCLDPANLRIQEGKNTITVPVTDKDTGELINTYYYEQNETAILPTVVKGLMEMKSIIKGELNKLNPEMPEYKIIEAKYASIKSIVNSAYGVMGNRFFRLYDKRVAESTTFLVRNLLMHTADVLKSEGRTVIYADTDSVFIDGKEDISKRLNEIVHDWGTKLYNNSKVSVEFEHEGYYEKLLVVAKCRYIGYLVNNKGKIKEEIKGVEVKRSDSSKYMAWYQKELITKILNKENNIVIFQWIRDQIEDMKFRPLEDIAFPCKLARRPEQYKNIPIFVRALEYANKHGFHKNIGELFYYIYVKPFIVGEEKITTYKYGNCSVAEKTVKELEEEVIKNPDYIFKWRRKEYNAQDFLEGIETSSKKKDVKGNVMAFDERTKNHIPIIDWKQMINRNIIYKTQTIFEAMDWDIKEIMPNKKPEKGKIV